MRFLLDAEQAEFGRTLDRMLGAADTPSVVRAWADGDPGPGRALWSRIAEAGVFALAVPEAHDGVGLLPVELVLAYVELGRHAVPGPVVETAAVATLLAGLPDGGGAAKEWLPRIASGDAVVTLGAGPGGYVADADAADAVFVVDGTQVRRAAGRGPLLESADPARRLFRVERGEVIASDAGPAVSRARDLAALLTAAQSLGVGLELLRRTVEYVGQRKQFGVEIGSFQAVKHRVADALLGLEFARPLLFGAALSMSAADVAGAKVAAGEAAHRAARTALQLHGAVGYTQELDLSLWLRKARPLRDAWGTPAQCRERVVTGAGIGARPAAGGRG
ncbi:acyl-CoA dehydrogenase family protein [Streptomyces sp. VRA16 Mangrove soil]|uniref:acyl-CoA dehydrogenase family protein n=1 Tax=Streptomyces sp. VRA16 Mangrove soil TaxID=2817434 RepID=UPI001AA0003C|nr:acyl-CoA dehydrogenase family protein [Streptomyces sp. VRA16 Mangrove soil]MBO1333490.1 acyl-CoA/acyl-ACP dehydrogenase [Streptomyces sp. VRA16 Mangrove soil]